MLIISLNIVLPIKLFLNLSPTGLTINFSKSSILFSKNTSAVRRDCAAQVHLTKVASFGEYLGFLCTVTTPTHQHFSFLLDKFQKALTNWSNKFLRFPGHLILLKSTLASLPIHVMQVCKLPSKTLDYVDRISRNFLWSGSQPHHRLHLVNWGTVTDGSSL